MSSLVALSSNPATLPALAAIQPVEAAMSARFEAERNRADTQRGAADRDSSPVRGLAVADRAGAGGRSDFRPQSDRRHFDARDERQGWPTSAYYAQHLSQEAFPDNSPSLDPAAAAAKYPSLGYNIDIFLPGETIVARTGNTRHIDITV